MSNCVIQNEYNDSDYEPPSIFYRDKIVTDENSSQPISLGLIILDLN